MAETIKEEIVEGFEINEETVFKEEELLPSSTVENTCSVYLSGRRNKEGRVWVEGEDDLYQG